MAKQSRRSRKGRARRKTTISTTSSSIEAQSAQKPEETLHPGEYAYVIADLRRVAILAAAMFALLIALSFFVS